MESILLALLLIIAGVLFGWSLGTSKNKKSKYQKLNSTFALITERGPDKNVFVRRISTGGNETMEFRVPGLDAREHPRIIPARNIKRFFVCDTPKRAEWEGAAEAYRDAISIAVAYRWVERNEIGRASCRERV